MAKKRPRAAAPTLRPSSPGCSKQEPGYWRKRLFRCRYTYKGKRFEVRKWSVKIQHLGKRKTFALHSGRPGEAAIEACELYRMLVAQGWKGLASQGGKRPGSIGPGQGRGIPAAPEPEALDESYWARRLIHREYTMSPQPAPLELSVRMDYGGAGHYFPLGTDNRRAAATRALRIYQTIVEHGWQAANSQFPRELTVAFRWLDVPLAWTYTTIHTLPAGSSSGQSDAGADLRGSILVTITEPDAGIRRALEWCVNHTEGFRCVAAYASVVEALRESRSRHAHLALISHSLADKPGPVCLAELKTVVPDILGLLYSVYEDSEELFRATPGGAGTYLLRRTLPTRFLEPIIGRLKAGRLLPEEMVPAAWQYFKDSVASLPVGPSTRHLANLTQREHEVLGLLSKGHPDKDIADRLGISIYTVHEHVKNVFDKLGAHNRTEAAVKFLQK